MLYYNLVTELMEIIMKIFLFILHIINILGNDNWLCEADIVKENTAIISCEKDHEGSRFLLDARDNSYILMSSYMKV